MSPMMHNTIAGNANHIPPEQVSSYRTEGGASWSRWDVNTFPQELLSHIFSYLECKDIARVQGTCKRFRELVEADRNEVFFYLLLPRPFRKQYPQSLSWQKWLINNHLHPFSTVIPDKIKRCLNAEQQAAMLCFNTLREMMSAPWYQSVEVFSCPMPAEHVQLEFSLTSSNLLFYAVSSGIVHLSSQNEAGSWSEQVVDPVTLPGVRLSAVLGLRNNECSMSISSSDNITETFKRHSHRNPWVLSSRSSGYEVNDYRFSSPGKYSAIFTRDKGFDSIRCFDDQGQWVPMPIASAGIGAGVQGVQFSPSEQHAAIISKNELVFLSLDGQGCWNFSGVIFVDHYVAVDTKDYRVNYVEFCPSGDWLLASVTGLPSSGSSLSSVIMLKSDLQWQYVQTISYDYKKLFFSSTGRYLVERDAGQLLVLCELDESGEWLPYRPPPTTLPLLRLGQTGQEQYTIALSPCDNFQCTSSSEGLVIIWGRVKKGGWESLGSKKFDRRVTLCKFSQSGVHALTVDRSSIYIWRRSEDGCWLVKGTIPATGVRGAYFHQAAEHLIIFWNSEKLRIWEIRKEDYKAVRE